MSWACAIQRDCGGFAAAATGMAFAVAVVRCNTRIDQTLTFFVYIDKVLSLQQLATNLEPFVVCGMKRATNNALRKGLPCVSQIRAP
jgi:hypothetical protein